MDMTMHELRARLDLADRAIDRALASHRHSYIFLRDNPATYAEKRKRLLDAFERRYDAIREYFMNEVA
jgi:hypothetical protein